MNHSDSYTWIKHILSIQLHFLRELLAMFNVRLLYGHIIEGWIPLCHLLILRGCCVSGNKVMMVHFCPWSSLGDGTTKYVTVLSIPCISWFYLTRIYFYFVVWFSQTCSDKAIRFIVLSLAIMLYQITGSWLILPILVFILRMICIKLVFEIHF